jgi:hypothetical protein
MCPRLRVRRECRLRSFLAGDGRRSAVEWPRGDADRLGFVEVHAASTSMVEICLGDIVIRRRKSPAQKRNALPMGGAS